LYDAGILGQLSHLTTLTDLDVTDALFAGLDNLQPLRLLRRLKLESAPDPHGLWLDKVSQYLRESIFMFPSLPHLESLSLLYIPLAGHPPGDLSACLNQITLIGCEMLDVTGWLRAVRLTGRSSIIVRIE
jgi:hypothetical protein